MSTPYRDTAKPPRKEVVVATFDAPHEAALALAYLESEDIEGRLQDDTLIGMAQLYSIALGGVKLWVDIEDAPDAKRLLDGYRVKPRSRKKRKHERADAVAKRAFRAAIIGLFVCPVGLHLYALWLLSTQLSGKLTTTGKRHAFGAHLISWSVLALCAWALLR
jgi:hypothetical protein